MRATLFGDPYPPNWKGDCQPPEMVFREVGDKVYIYFPRVCYAFSSTGDRRFDRCGHFQADRALYLFDPCNTSTLSPQLTRSMQSCTTSFMKDDVYRQYICQCQAWVLHMPPYTLDELQLVGEHLRSTANLSASMVEYFSAANIASRFSEYGGVFRYIFPPDETYLTTVLSVERDAVLGDKNLIEKILTRNASNERLAHYCVTTNSTAHGTHLFETYTLEYASENVRQRLHGLQLATARALDTADLVAQLSFMDQFKTPEPVALPFLYREYFARWPGLRSGGLWQQTPLTGDTVSTVVQNVSHQLQTMTVTGQQSTGSVYLAVGGVYDTTVPQYSTMVVSRLYYPSHHSYPCVHLLVKRGDGSVAAFHVTRNKEPQVLSTEAYNALLQSLGLTVEECKRHVRYYLVPPPNALNAVLSLSPGVEFASVRVFYVPTNYAW